MTRRITEKNIGLLILGESLVALSLGSIYSLRLVKSGLSFAIFIGATLIAIYYINNSFLTWYRGGTTKPFTQLVGLVGGFFLLLFFGIQSPQLPFKNYILIIGFLLVLPALRELFRGAD